MAAVLCLLLVAARPLPDLHKWDSYFALFAPDSSVPWKVASVRLDTYSGAPVDFAVYQADPADVIVAGTGARPRTFDTRRRRRVARWRFSPAPGYRFDSNLVTLPLGSREGFFVVEARRNNVAEQVWVNRTRVGLLAKTSATEVLLYGADLGTGRALANMRVNVLSAGRFETRYTDAHGVLRLRDRARAVFALAQYGRSQAFVSLLPQAPAPPAVAGIVVDSAVVRAGDTVRVAGFARLRGASSFKPSRGEAEVTLRRGPVALASQRAPLDSSGAFTATLHVPADTPSGEYPVLAVAGPAAAGTTVYVDGNAGGIALSAAAACEGTCPPNDDVPVVVRATRAGAPAAQLPVHVEIVRSPHVFSGSERNRPWGITTVVSQDAVTGDDGTARISIARPNDGLASTYGVRVTSGAAAAATRIVVPTSSVALDLEVDRTEEPVGNAIAFEVSAASVTDGKPAANLPVRVRLIHSGSAQEQTLMLDAHGRARGAFTRPELGSNLILARATAAGEDTLDAQEVQVDPQAAAFESGSRSPDVRVEFARAHYAPGERVDVTASSSGTAGDALLTYETPAGFDAAVVPVRDGTARAAFSARNAAGSIGVGAAFVHDGTLRWNVAPLALQGAGRPQSASVHIDGDVFAPGALVNVKIDDGTSADRTVIVRMTSGTPSGAARFAGTPDLLAVGEAASQDSAPPDVSWHAWVDAGGARATSGSFERRDAALAQDASVADAQTSPLYWNVLRTGSGALTIPLPQKPGAYTISVLELGDDGHVAATAQSIVVR